MKKCIILLLILIVFIQVINIINNANYVWEIIIAEFAFLFIITCFFVLFNLKKFKKLIVKFNQGDYEYVIACKKMYLGNITEKQSQFFYMKSISYLEMGDYDNFNYYLDKITHKKLLIRKYFYKIMYYTLINNLGQQKLYEDNFYKCNCFNQDEKIYFKIICLLKKNEPFTQEEIDYINSFSFSKIKQILFAKNKKIN